KLKLYSFFHLNLMYSSIEEASRKEVIHKCYWPLFKLADLGIPIGIEAPAVTLEYINKLDPDWISSLSKYIAAGKIEFIGSGYSQIIGPLIPAKVNKRNQELGIECYQKLLGINPKIALVNEMAYSGGIVDHYIDAGYQGLIMEWNNPRSAHPDWGNEWRYFPQNAIGPNGESIPLIWTDSIAFQKFQRLGHGEYELEEYIQYLKSHRGEIERFFPIYSNDVEIFDYRPGRYKTETQINGNSEWDSIIELYTYLYQQDWCEFVFPNQVLSGLNNEMSGKDLRLESPSQPIPVKKQEKYNINRWALTGRDDLGINTKCYQIYNSFIENDNSDPEDWKELTYLWSSDFRTHITEKRWYEYINRMDIMLGEYCGKKIENEGAKSNNVELNEDEKWITLENDNYKIALNKHKGLSIKSLVIKKYGEDSILGTLNHGYYDDISFGADYYSGHAVIERPGEHKVTDLGMINPVVDQNIDEVVSTQKWGNYTFNQKIKFQNEKVVFEKQIDVNTSEKAIIRPFNYTFNPEAWDRNSLYVATHNGGSTLEKFYLKGQNISHGNIYSSLISARHGFGNTEGIFVVGDKNKEITFNCDMSVSPLIPSVIYKEMDDSYFFRLQYSALEMDETKENASEINPFICNLYMEVLC
ncbi:MAG: glycoside hydrolase family 57, partial [Candidatus Marinimicrobia bacterium]|nr:glycoside hydrolase family 57 [Candidatus Neomarinimicrobiota bacterium]